MKYNDILLEMKLVDRKRDIERLFEGMLSNIVSPTSLLIDLGVPPASVMGKQELAILLGFKNWVDLEIEFLNHSPNPMDVLKQLKDMTFEEWKDSGNFTKHTPDPMYLVNRMKAVIAKAGGNAEFVKQLMKISKKPEGILLKLLS